MSIAPIQWSGRTSAPEHAYDNWREKSLPPTTPIGLRQVWWTSGRRAQVQELTGTAAPTTQATGEKVWFLDAQNSTCPAEVAEEVHNLWYAHGLGNEDPHLETSLQDLADGAEDDFKPPVTAILQWVREQAPAIEADDVLVIHWWW